MDQRLSVKGVTLVYPLRLAVFLVSTVLSCVAFASPYWVVSVNGNFRENEYGIKDWQTYVYYFGLWTVCTVQESCYVNNKFHSRAAGVCIGISIFVVLICDIVAFAVLLRPTLRVNNRLLLYTDLAYLLSGVVTFIGMLWFGSTYALDHKFYILEYIVTFGNPKLSWSFDICIASFGFTVTSSFLLFVLLDRSFTHVRNDNIKSP